MGQGVERRQHGLRVALGTGDEVLLLTEAPGVAAEELARILFAACLQRLQALRDLDAQRQVVRGLQQRPLHQRPAVPGQQCPAAVENVVAVTLAFEQPGAAHQLEMVAEGRLAHVQHLAELRHAHRVAPQQAQDQQAQFVGTGLAQLRQRYRVRRALAGVRGSAAGWSCGGHGRAV
jgi:hypothetical protein